MKARRLLLPATLAVLLAPASARADGLAGRFSIAVQVGTQSDVAGDLINSTQGTLIGQPATLQAKRYRDVYRPALRLQAFAGYGVGAKLELFLRGSYYEAKKAGIEAGTFAAQPMFLFFDRYREVGAELGLRYYIAPQSRLKSYIGPVVGLRHLDEVLVSFSIPNAGSAVLNVPFSKGGSVAVFGADLGFDFDLSRSFFVGVDTGLRYQQAPASFGSLPELGAFEGTGGRWTAPVTATVGVRF
jgi:hypothetical protein